MNGMKGFLLCVAMLLGITGLSAQMQNWIWEKQVNATCKKIVTDNAGNSYIFGTFSGTVTFDDTILTSTNGNKFLGKMDTTGTWLWVMQGSVSVTIGDIALDASGNLYVIGDGWGMLGSVGISQYTPPYYVYVIKFNDQGQSLWLRQYFQWGGPADGQKIAIDIYGDYYIAGYVENDVGYPSVEDTSVYVAKYSSSGDYLWVIPVNFSNHTDVTGLCVDNLGYCYFMAGGYLLKTNGSGYTPTLWSYQPGQGYSIDSFAYDNSGNIVVTGGFSGTVSFGTISLTSFDGWDMFVAKLDTSGNWIWATKAGSAGGSDNGIGISVDNAGNSFITGEFAATALFGAHSVYSNGETDLFAAKIDASGNWLWAKSSGASLYDRGMDIDYDANGSVYCIKTISGGSQTSYSIIKGNPPYLHLLSPQGGEVWQTMSLKAVYWYPNPDITLVNIKLSVNNGSSWFYLNANPVSILDGSYTFSVPAVQSSNCLIRIESATDPNLWYDVSDQTFTISSSDTPSVTLTAPDNQNLKLQSGRDYDVIWEANQITNVSLGVSYDAGNSWHSLAQGLPITPNTYLWTVPDSLYTRCYLRVEDYQVSTIYDWSDHSFTICKLEINSPSENDIWVEATTRIITWNQTNLTNVKLEYTTDGGILWQTIVSSINASTGSYGWLVPKLYSTQCKLRISDADDNTIFDVSDNTFTIRPQIILSNLNGGEYLQIYSIYRILWDAAAEVSQVSLDYSVNGGATWLALQETPYDASLGYYDWFVPNAPSSQALVRIKKVGDASIFDVSETVFTITAEIPPANLSLLSSTSVNFGTVFLEESSQFLPVVISNTGGQDLVISTVHFMGEPQHFELQQPLPDMTLISGEIDTLLVRFIPQSVGALSDTLYIVNNSFNEPLLKIRLSGTGEYVPPNEPENLQISMIGNGAVISWDAVVQNTHDIPIDVDCYLVFSSSDPYSVFTYHGTTTDLSYSFPLVGQFQSRMFYRVVAYKYYGQGAFDIRYLGLVQGMPEEDVWRILRD